MSAKINIGIIGIVGQGAPSEKIVKSIMKQQYNHNHIWEPIKGSTDVKCIICGIKAMQACSNYKESEGE